MINRRLISIILILIFTLPTVLTQFWLMSEKYFAKKQIVNQIYLEENKNKIVVLNFTETEAKSLLTWENQSEFKYKNNIYDVLITSRNSNNTLTYTCFLDEKESKINNLLDFMVDFHLQKNKNSTQKLQQLLLYFNLLFSEDYTINLKIKPTFFKLSIFKYLEYFTQKINTKIIKPPEIF